MSVTSLEETALNDALDMLHDSATRGCVPPVVVVSVIDNICVDLRKTLNDLPVEIHNLRSDAQSRNRNHDVGYREDWLADKLALCAGLWAA